MDTVVFEKDTGTGGLPWVASEYRTALGAGVDRRNDSSDFLLSFLAVLD